MCPTICFTTGIRYFERLHPLYPLVSLVTQLKGACEDHFFSFITTTTVQVLFSTAALTS